MAFTRRDYEAYIASPQWAAKRERAFKKHGRACKACGSTDPGLHVHHHTYERFRRERLDDLVILCKPCHTIVHKFHNQQRFAKGPNLTLTEVTYAFLRKANPTVYSAEVLADHTPTALPALQRASLKDRVARERIARAKAEQQNAKPPLPTDRVLRKRAAQDKAWRKAQRKRSA